MRQMFEFCKQGSLILFLQNGSGEFPNRFVSYFDLFFNGFLTPRLTRYTDAPRIAPSAKAARGVPANANKIDIIRSPQNHTEFLLTLSIMQSTASEITNPANVHFIILTLPP